MLSDKISTLKLQPPLTVQSTASIGQVVDEVQRRCVGCVLVYEGRSLVGIMTERDVLMKVVARDVSSRYPVEQFMTPSPTTITPNHTIGEAIDLISRTEMWYIPVIDPNTGQAVAIFSIRDVINYLAESFPEKVINLPPRPHQKMTTPEGA